MIVVSDTSPLGSLALIDHLRLLQSIYATVIIPDRVANELAAARDTRIQQILTLEWIQVQSLGNADIAKTLQEVRKLDPGEAYAIALAIQIKADKLPLLTQLQAQHPNVTTETEALAIIDAEFTDIKQSPSHRLTTLRQQILNPERHAQAIKATVGEVAKHYLEEGLLAKLAITYFDKMSETPDYGA